MLLVYVCLESDRRRASLAFAVFEHANLGTFLALGKLKGLSPADTFYMLQGFCVICALIRGVLVLDFLPSISRYGGLLETRCVSEVHAECHISTANVERTPR
jgi:hypothetical protein